MRKPVELARCITRPLLCKPTALSRHSVEVKSRYLCSNGEQQDLLILHVPKESYNLQRTVLRSIERDMRNVRADHFGNRVTQLA